MTELDLSSMNPADLAAMILALQKQIAEQAAVISSVKSKEPVYAAEVKAATESVTGAWLRLEKDLRANALQITADVAATSLSENTGAVKGTRNIVSYPCADPNFEFYGGIRRKVGKGGVTDQRTAATVKAAATKEASGNGHDTSNAPTA